MITMEEIQLNKIAGMLGFSNYRYMPSFHVKQLEDELLKLLIENAYLKELRRLRLEDEARLREQQESSKASEETSN